MAEELADGPSEDAIAQAYGELFEGLDQFGPGSSATRARVLAHLVPRLPPAPVIADMGAGVGVASLELARQLPAAHVIAIDRQPAFLDRLSERAAAAEAKIDTLAADMAAPGLDPASLDLVWCESAIYAVGRTAALATWRPLLGPDGLVAFSDVVWTRPDPPAAAREFWAREYPAMTTVDAVTAEIAAVGYRPCFTSTAPSSDWQGYYDPLRERLAKLKPAGSGGSSDPALAFVLASMRREIAVFDAHGDAFASVWFVAAAAG